MSATSAFLKAIAVFLDQSVIGMNAEAYRLRLRYSDRRVSDEEFRCNMADVQSKWGDLVYHSMAANLHIQARFDLPAPVEEPCIVISNHQSTLDMPILFHVIRVLRLRVRWVMKSSLQHLPIIGPMAVDSGCAFVKRAKDPEDLRRIREAAAGARRDGTGMLIFPEGTRYQPRLAARSPFRRLLAPKLGGFGVIREEMPTAPVLLVTINWNRVPGRTIFDAASFYGARLTTQARLIPAAQVDQDPDWLMQTWARMDRELMT